MLQILTKTAWRNLIIQKGYTIVNIIGLALGMACCILILLLIQDELSYDKFHQNADNLYRLISEAHISDKVSRFPFTPAPMAEDIKKEIPEIIETTRFFIMGGSRGSWVIKRGDKAFVETGGGFADPSFFEMFSFPFIAGSSYQDSDSPFSIVLTRCTANKYFGNENPIGQTLNLDGTRDFRVTGVIEDPPPNSHIHFDFLMPVSVFTEYGFRLDKWEGLGSMYTYVYLQYDASIEVVAKKIGDIFRKADNKKDK